jgi:CRISPR-associated protein Cas1
LERILLITTPCKLFTERGAVVVSGQQQSRVPLSDIDLIILEHQQITLTHPLIAKCLELNIGLIFCNYKSMPIGYSLPFSGHTLAQKFFKLQVEQAASQKHEIWSVLLNAKIQNQLAVLSLLDIKSLQLRVWARRLSYKELSGVEGQAARIYWQAIADCFDTDFYRDRLGPPPNHALNYAYAILRSCTARALVSAGLHPMSGIFHSNQYNPSPLADDLIEPFRPFADLLVFRHFDEFSSDAQLSPLQKQMLIQLLLQETTFNGQRVQLGDAIRKSAILLRETIINPETDLTFPAPS